MNQPGSGSSSPLKGDLPYEMLGPRVIRVFIADDSPEESRHNAKVYGVHIVVEGTREEGPIRLSSMEGEFYDPRLEPVVIGGLPLGGDAREAVGVETIVYEFSIPADITAHSARFHADVSDDYRIGVRQIYDFPGLSRSGELDLEERVWPDDFVSTEAGTRRPFKWDIEKGKNPTTPLLAQKGLGKTDRIGKLSSLTMVFQPGKTYSPSMRRPISLDSSLAERLFETIRTTSIRLEITTESGELIKRGRIGLTLRKICPLRLV